MINKIKKNMSKVITSEVNKHVIDPGLSNIIEKEVEIIIEAIKLEKSLIVTDITKSKKEDEVKILLDKYINLESILVNIKLNIETLKKMDYDNINMLENIILKYRLNLSILLEDSMSNKVDIYELCKRISVTTELLEKIKIYSTKYIELYLNTNEIEGEE